MSVAAPLALREGDEKTLNSLVRSSSGRAGVAQRARIVLRVAGLDDLDRPGRPVQVDEIAIVVTTVAEPPERLGVTHWSARLLADHLDCSFATIARVWRKWDLQPWRTTTFKFSTDPELDAKVRDIVALYLHPRAPRSTDDSSGGERPPPPDLSQQGRRS